MSHVFQKFLPNIPANGMNFSRRFSLLPLILAMASAGSGCGDGSNAASAPLVEQTVTGKVVLANGKPLSRGQVTLIPLQEPFMPLYGTLKPDGSFTLGAGGVGTNVSHGEFQVSVEPLDYRAGTKPKGLPFPAKYLNETTSGLKATITPETKELQTIELK